MWSDAEAGARGRPLAGSEVLKRLTAFDPFAGAVLPYLLLDVFTESPLAGNPLALVTDGRALAGEQMQRIARELALSETVFALPPQRAGDVHVRIFTPASELPFAGHPVLGCAVALGAALGRAQVTIETQAGPVAVELERRGARRAWGRMRQPLPSWAPYEHHAALLAALGVESSRLPVEIYANGPRYVFVALASQAELAALRPDMRALAALGDTGAACFAGSGSCWSSRVFLPALGVPEDPATGSAAGPLAVHLARHRLIAFGEEIEIRQGAEVGRPSVLRACAYGSAAGVERVEVAGAAVIVARGVLVPDG